MIILRALKYLFFTIIALCLVAFLYLITSKDVTQKIFNYLSVEFPIKYSKVDGSIYEGIKIYDLNYDDMIKSKNYISKTKYYFTFSKRDKSISFKSRKYRNRR